MPRTDLDVPRSACRPEATFHRLLAVVTGFGLPPTGRTPDQKETHHMSTSPDATADEQAATSPRLAVLLAAAMFVLVVDTSFMNVSISAVVKDLDTTASGVQSAIALEALVSAAFILINSKMGDLIGRKLAYVLGLLAYAVGALAMTLTHSLTSVIIFWAIIGGLGALVAAPRHAVAHPRQLRGGSAEEERTRSLAPPRRSQPQSDPSSVDS